MNDELLGGDAAAVRELGERVTLALKGDVRAAYDDRSGETWSV